MVYLKRDRLIYFKGKTPWRMRGANDQDCHDNEASVLKENHDITLHETLAKI